MAAAGHAYGMARAAPGIKLVLTGSLDVRAYNVPNDNSWWQLCQILTVLFKRIFNFLTRECLDPSAEWTLCSTEDERI